MIKENTPTLTTERLILRKFAKDDVDDVLLLYSDEEVNTFLPWYPLKTIEQAKDYLDNTILPQYDKDIAYSYAIELKSTGRMVGYVHIHDIGDANDIGYALSKEYWGQGIIVEACKRIVEHLKTVNFPYLTATHDINNPNSGKVMRKMGMTYRYTYQEQVQPKDILVNFRMYQLNLDGNNGREYVKYWNKYPHNIESIN